VSVAPAQSTRERIRAVAVDLFHQQGYGGTGLREIADLASVNVASIYHHFRSKEDLLLAIIVETCRATYEPAKRQLEAAPDPAAALVALTRHHIEFHCNRAAEAAITDRELGALRMPARREALALRDAYEQLWGTVLREGEEAGLFTVDDHELVRIAALSLCSQVAAWYRPGGRLTVPEIATIYARLVLRLVGYRPRRAPGEQA
jgi:AcrR family transcriptional regulator